MSKTDEPSAGRAPNEGPEHAKIAAAINSYIPPGRPYDEERFALHRWLNAATEALHERGKAGKVEGPPPPGEQWIWAELVKVWHGLACVKVPPNCVVIDPGWPHGTVAVMPPATGPVQALEVAAVGYAADPGPETRAYLQRCAFDLALMIVEKLKPTSMGLVYLDGYDDAVETLRRFQRRAAEDSGSGSPL